MMKKTLIVTTAICGLALPATAIARDAGDAPIAGAEAGAPVKLQGEKEKSPPMMPGAGMPGGMTGGATMGSEMMNSCPMMNRGQPNRQWRQEPARKP